MNITLIGAGAIGGYLAARLSTTGQKVSVIARGATLSALQQKGIGISEQGQPAQFFPVNAVSAHDPLPVQDLILIAVKEPSLAAIAPLLPPLIGPNTRIMTAMNGIPWWFPAGIHSSPLRPLRSLDPEGRLSQSLPDDQILGGVVHMACSNSSPGIVQHNMGNRLIIGNATAKTDPRLGAVIELFNRAGMTAEQSGFIQKDVWFKL